MFVLIACEESQRVCIAFRKRGFEAYSCDILPCSGGHPEWHICCDVKEVIKPLEYGFLREFHTQNGTHHLAPDWDLIIAHPPCTYLSNVATRSFSLRVTAPEKVVARWEDRAKAAIFFMYFALANCKHIAIENPVGWMNTAYRKPDQLISPWQFAKDINDMENYHTKRTCLWLKNLPLLKTNNIPAPDLKKLNGVWSNGKAKCWEESIHGKDRAGLRSKTFPGIAEAMAEQWGNYILNEEVEQ